MPCSAASGPLPSLSRETIFSNRFQPCAWVWHDGVIVIKWTRLWAQNVHRFVPGSRFNVFSENTNVSYTRHFNNLIRSQEATLFGANFSHSQNFITGYLWLQDQIEPASQGDVGTPLLSQDKRGRHVSFTVVVCHLDTVVALREGQLTCVAREWPVLLPEPQLPDEMMK